MSYTGFRKQGIWGFFKTHGKLQEVTHYWSCFGGVLLLLSVCLLAFMPVVSFYLSDATHTHTHARTFWLFVWPTRPCQIQPNVEAGHHSRRCLAPSLTVWRLWCKGLDEIFLSVRAGDTYWIIGAGEKWLTLESLEPVGVRPQKERAQDSGPSSLFP